MLEVSYPCITNPSATNNELPRYPFDLHASSTPSAFNLNQDQILTEKKIFENLSILFKSQKYVRQVLICPTQALSVCMHIILSILSKHRPTLKAIVFLFRSLIGLPPSVCTVRLLSVSRFPLEGTYKYSEHLQFNATAFFIFS